jgi:hypothetical protein
MSEQTEFYKEEIKEISRITTLAQVAFGGGILSIIGGAVSVGYAEMTNIHLIAGGYSAISIGVLLATIGTVAARDHAKLMEHDQCRHRILLDLVTVQHAEVLAAIERNHAEYRRRFADLERAWQREADTVGALLQDELQAKRRAAGTGSGG